MIPYSYNMVDMGGIDLAEVNGTVVEGLYNRLALARNACGDLILFNWKFAGIEIAPGACSTLDAGTSILINGAIEVTDQDVISIPGIVPEPTLVPLVATENGTYSPEAGVDGFSNVFVNVRSELPEIVDITLTAGVTFGGSSFRFGSYFFLSGRFNFSSGAGWRVLGTIPVDYSPQSDKGFMAGHGGNVAVRDGIVNANGEIRIFTESSDTYLQTCFFYNF